MSGLELYELIKGRCYKFFKLIKTSIEIDELVNEVYIQAHEKDGDIPETEIEGIIRGVIRKYNSLSRVNKSYTEKNQDGLPVLDVNISSDSTCTKCKQVLPDCEFHTYVHRDGTRKKIPRCYECRSEYNRKQYVKNKERNLELNRKYKKAHRQKMRYLNKKNDQKNRRHLTDSYIKERLRDLGIISKASEATQEQINEKRQFIINYRIARAKNKKNPTRKSRAKHFTQ